MNSSPVLFLLRAALLGLALLLALPLHAEDGVSIAVEDIDAGPAFSAHGIRLALGLAGTLRVQVDEVRALKRSYQNLDLQCGQLLWQGNIVQCQQGKLAHFPDVSMSLRYDLQRKQLDLAFSAPGGERWQLAARLRSQDWQVAGRWQNAQLSRLTPWLPPGLPTVSQGKLDGELHVNGHGKVLSEARLEARFAQLAFADASGLHAGEKLGGVLQLGATPQASGWQWQADLQWQQGELFWQPLYLTSQAAAPHHFRATGDYDGALLTVNDALVSVPEVGQLQLSGRWDMAQRRLLHGELRGQRLELEKMFALYAQPFLDKSLLARAHAEGQVDVAWVYRDGATRRFELDLHDAGLRDDGGRFQLHGLNTLAHWQPEQPSLATLSFQSAEFMGLPLGAVQWQMRMNGRQFNVDEARLPILDGALVVRDAELHHENDAWHWRFGGMLYPISMEKLSALAGWPKMLGTLGGLIPQVRYEQDRITVDGELVFRVFGGAIGLSGLEFTQPFSRKTARAVGNLKMRNLNLGMLTRTFSFGNIEGLIDADVNNLVLQSWQPLRFDARVASSPGNYTKKISQRAVQNISSLGGSGVAAAIQRSVVGVFENFGYEEIGWSCALRNDLCLMGGVANRPDSSYALIIGGGIPAINVIGYNHHVSWSELVSRLQRVIQNNRQVIVVK